jgi:hypothetical protein
MRKRIVLTILLLSSFAYTQENKPLDVVALPDTDRQVVISASTRVSLSECQRDLEDLRAQLRIAQKQIELRLGPEYKFNYQDLSWHRVK